jgi:two-component system chemotaxis response regulator CheB
MPTHDIIVIGASAGGVEALRNLVRKLPGDLPASIFITLHVPPGSRSLLPRILDRAGPLPVRHAQHGEPIEAGRVYVAPPGRHLLIEPGRVTLSHGPRENRWRPAVDPLFRTAAHAYGSRVVGVVLSGVLDDGTVGLLAIKRRGGVAIVQDPDDALFPGMPGSALASVDVDYRLALREIPELLVRLAHQLVDDEGATGVSGDVDKEAELAAMNPDVLFGEERVGAPSAYGCPDCGGVLWEIQDGAITRYRCRVGHAYSSDSLLLSMNESIEDALWTALRALEERASLASRLADRALEHGSPQVATRFRDQSTTMQRHMEVIRRVLADGAPANALNASSDTGAERARSGE